MILQIIQLMTLVTKIMIMKNKTTILLLFTVLINCQILYAQNQIDSFTKQYKNGNYLINSDIKQYLGNWKSEDGKFTFEITKSINTIKNRDLDFKTDVLIFKLIDVINYKKSNEKILKKPVTFMSVNKSKAYTIFKDPTTANEVDLILMFKNKDLIEFFALNSIHGDRKKGYYFPEKMVLKRVK